MIQKTQPRGLATWTAGPGYLDRGAGLPGPRGRHLDRGAGHLDRGAGHLDRGAGHLDRAAGHLDRGAGHLDWDRDRAPPKSNFHFFNAPKS